MILQDAGSEGGILMQFSQVNDLTCQTCAYWMQRRGSFGVCKTFPERKAYDGSRKGSACIGWRISNNSLQSFPKKGQETKEHHPSLRKIYNDSHKPKFKATYATNVDGEFITYTSDIHCKNGYYKHRYNYTLIDVALTLFLQGKSFKQVVEHMKGNYMKPMSRRTFREWVIKFLGQKAWDDYQYYVRPTGIGLDIVLKKRKSNTKSWYQKNLEKNRLYILNYKRNRYRKVWNGEKYVYILRNEQPLRKYVKSGKYSKKIRV